MKLVIIDDESIVIQGLAAIIKRLGLDAEVVGSADNGLDGLAVIRQNHPDVVITDIRMPGLDGLSMIEEVREEFDDIDFIVISGYTDFVYTKRAISLGVVDYLDKPLTIEKIREVFSRIEARKNTEAKTLPMQMGDELVINALILEDAELLRTETEAFLKKLDIQHPSLGSLKEACYRFLCVVQEIYAGQRKKYDDSFLIPCSEIMKIESRDEVFDYVRTNVFHIASIMETSLLGSDNKIINRLLQYINDNYDKDIGLAELSDMAGLNPAYLSILFKGEVGTSYVKYLTNLRMEKAKKFLNEGNKVADVSAMVGYNNYRYFCDIFKKHVGMTPTEYKNEA